MTEFDYPRSTNEEKHTMRTTYLADMNWHEAEQAFAQTDLVFIPAGAVEAHGPHGLLGTDHFAADEVAKRAAAKCGAIALPSIPFGYCESTMDFPGTISIDPITYNMLLENVVRSVYKWGARRVIWITGHGPNAPIMKQVSLKLRGELGMIFAAPLWYRLAIALMPELKLGPDHGGFTETSVAMAIRPGNANLAGAEGGCVITDIGGQFDSTGKYDIMFENIGIEIPMFMRERWPLGYWDNSKPAVEASEEVGEQILEVVTDYLGRFGNAFRELPLATVQQRA
jgi:creatinine amidohydrolase